VSDSRPAAELAVDIVIDNYNYGAYLGAAIESACAQTHERLSVIVVDDGSTDNSRELLLDYGDRDRVEVVLKENGGQASALNAGFGRCRGDIAIVLDADDLLHPEAAARVAAAFAADPALAKVQYRMDTIDAGGHSTGVIKPPAHLPMPNGDVRRDELAFPFDLTWLAMSGNAFRLEALRRILPIPEPAYRICADWYLVHLTALLGPIASLQEVSASYRVHGANGYEQQAARLDLDHVRRTVGLAGSTIGELERLADELGLERPDPILSLWDLANRLISLKLDPRHHPIATDSAAGIVRGATRAIPLRSDASPPKKLLFLLWFALTAAAPRRYVPRLAELFLYPERRPAFNHLLGRLRRRQTGDDLAGLA
jgi:glycosyltransferase involved in cell wall biosynthesis